MIETVSVNPMRLTRRVTMQAFSDAMTIGPALDKTAEEYRAAGWTVERGICGVVILRLQGGEVHFVPSGSTIEQLIFEN